jgi:hypothetical protein
MVVALASEVDASSKPSTMIDARAVLKKDVKKSHDRGKRTAEYTGDPVGSINIMGNSNLN